MARSRLEIAPEFLAAVVMSNDLTRYAEQRQMMDPAAQQDLVEQLIQNQEKIALLADEWAESDA
jgi:hypothetical protein